MNIIDAIREVANHPSFDELVMREKTLTKELGCWVVKQSYGRWDDYATLDEAVANLIGDGWGIIDKEPA